MNSELEFDLEYPVDKQKIERQNNKMTVTVYTNPNCIQCDKTKKILDQNNISYDVVDLSENDGARNMVMEMGYRQAPVVITDNDHWSGLRVDKLKDLVMGIDNTTK